MGCFHSSHDPNDQESWDYGANIKRVAQYGRLSCWYTNATSLKNKLGLLQTMNSDYDVLMVTETWLRENSDADIAGYTCFRQDRTFGKLGGGVCIYVKRALEAKPTKSEILNSTEAEQVWCKLKIDSKRILMGCIYRPPRASRQTSEAINQSLKFAWKQLKQKHVDRVLICGDFNYPNLSWTGGLVPTNFSPSQIELEFKQLVEKLNAFQNIKEKTFQKDHGELTNTLDLILTEKPNRCREMAYGKPLGETKKGHLQIAWQYKFKNRGLIRKMFFCVSG